MHWNPAVGIPLLIIGLIVLALIWLFGQPRKPGQGKRVSGSSRRSRREPALDSDEAAANGAPAPDDATDDVDATSPQQGELDMGMREELERLGATLAGEQHQAASAAKRASGAAPVATPAPSPPKVKPSRPAPPPSTLGERPPDRPLERIVSLFVVARDGHRFHGSDLVVAMEKAGLEYGAMGAFHRLLDGKAEQGAVFSVANMVKPGSFDMTTMTSLETPGITFFMTLPGPLSALDAWDAMLPTAQRLGKLLEGLVLDGERNALGRQRIAHIRDDLRGWDRAHDSSEG